MSGATFDNLQALASLIVDEVDELEISNEAKDDVLKFIRDKISELI